MIKSNLVKYRDKIDNLAFGLFECLIVTITNISSIDQEPGRKNVIKTDTKDN